MAIAARPQLRSHLVGVQVLVDQPVDLRRSLGRPSTRSFTPHVFTDTPKRISASTLSPSVTATLRMLSPVGGASCRGWCPAAARAHRPTDAWTAGSLTWPNTVLRSTPMRVWTTRELAVAVGGLVQVHEVHVDEFWQRLVRLRVQVEQRLAEACSPPIHIFAGENVCIHAIRRCSGRRGEHRGRLGGWRPRWSAPGGRRSAPARRTGLEPAGDLAGLRGHLLRVSSPYRPWLPVRNQTSSSSSGDGSVIVAAVRRRSGSGRRGGRRRPGRWTSARRAGGRCAPCGTRPRT